MHEVSPRASQAAPPGPASPHRRTATRSVPGEGSPGTGTVEGRYTIPFAESPGALCCVCDEQETGAGPVGYLDDSPVCDLCLLRGAHHLGMVLAVIAVVRAYAAASDEPHELRDALFELGAFARVYERYAAKSWPARSFTIPGLAIDATRRQ